jgi:hypothetical protein
MSAVLTASVTPLLYVPKLLLVDECKIIADYGDDLVAVLSYDGVDDHAVVLNSVINSTTQEEVSLGDVSIADGLVTFSDGVSADDQVLIYYYTENSFTVIDSTVFVYMADGLSDTEVTVQYEVGQSSQLETTESLDPRDSSISRGFIYLTDSLEDYASCVLTASPHFETVDDTPTVTTIFSTMSGYSPILVAAQLLDSNGNPMSGVDVTWTYYDGSSTYDLAGEESTPLQTAACTTTTNISGFVFAYLGDYDISATPGDPSIITLYTDEATPVTLAEIEVAANSLNETTTDNEEYIHLVVEEEKIQQGKETTYALCCWRDGLTNRCNTPGQTMLFYINGEDGEPISVAEDTEFPYTAVIRDKVLEKGTTIYVVYEAGEGDVRYSNVVRL